MDVQKSPKELINLVVSQRFLVVTAALEVALLAEATVHMGTQGRFGQFTASALIICAIAVAISTVLARRGNKDLASLILLWSIVVLLNVLVFHGQGVRDIAMLGYPAVLVVASLIVSGRRLTALALWIACTSILQGILELKGVLRYDIPDVGWGLILDCFAILGVTVACVIVVSRELQATLKRSQELALNDHLTGLPNRAAARALFENIVARARREHSMAAVLFVDLDEFKSINDSAGHAVGDEVLKQVAARLKKTLRSSDTVSRQGGDEFVIFLDRIHGVGDIPAVIGKILAEMALPIRVARGDHTTSCSIGVAIFPQDGGDFDTLLKCADIAMYQAKAAGRNTFAFYDDSTNQKLLKQIRISNGLSRALAGEELHLDYQPLVNLEDGSVIGAEALLRWRSSELGDISPAQFIPVAENSGRIIEIGAWVLGRACAEAVRWHSQGMDDLRISVNVSAVQLVRGDLLSAVRAALGASGLDPRMLELELTESAFIHDTEHSMAVVAELKAMGVRIAMDDFGTGYSSLSYLQRFQLDTIKIDKAFVMKLQSGTDDAAITRAIIQMAQALGLSTTAEGIETQEALDFLTANGCKTGQGYLYARPLSRLDFLQFALDRRALARVD